ncbi:PREDICTED: F-box protein At2g27310-like [Tarenaya hassleriana]|uniref:F-box protein At2g27310-like n=1 Tax=Tarenaya hassleriana TaxID=28532 RepID=UPI00053C49FF|nr:PREDICTED: F-box protein At2g27310-like [Tarenaya hassleriana]
MASRTVDLSSTSSISAVHPEVFRTHILSRLDGPTLASAAATSSYFHTLCSDQTLWRQISTATWPSINDPRVLRLITSFPSGFISFFSDSYPLPDPNPPSIPGPTPPEKFISAVDLYYRGHLIYSKVQETAIETGSGSESELASGRFMDSPFRVDLLDPKETVPTKLRYPGGNYESWVRDMEENTTLNWVIIDPTRKRSANVSSRRAVSAQRNWVTGNLELRFAAAAAETAGVTEVVAVGAGDSWKEVDEEVGGEVHVRDVRLQVEDMEGKCMNGKDSLVILQGLLQGKRLGIGEEEEDDEGGRVMKTRYEEYVEAKKRWRERKERRERAKDYGFMVFGCALFLLLWSLILFR